MGFCFAPRLGLITNTTARILLKSKSTGAYTLRYGCLGEHSHKHEIFLNGLKPTVVCIERLKPKTEYFFEVSHSLETFNEIYSGSFTTLNTPFSITFPYYNPIKEDRDVYHKEEIVEVGENSVFSFLYKGCRKDNYITEEDVLFHLPIPFSSPSPLQGKEKKKGRVYSKGLILSEKIKGVSNDRTCMWEMLSPKKSNVPFSIGTENMIDSKWSAKNPLILTYGNLGFFYCPNGESDKFLEEQLNAREYFDSIEKWIYVSFNFSSKVLKKEENSSRMHISVGRLGSLTTLREKGKGKGKIVGYHCTTGNFGTMNKLYYWFFKRNKGLDWSTRHPNSIGVESLEEGVRIYFNGKNEFVYTI